MSSKSAPPVVLRPRADLAPANSAPTPAGDSWQPPALLADQLLTPDQVAGLLCIQRSTVLDLLRRGELPGAKLGKFWLIRRSALEAALDEKFGGAG